MRNKLTIAVLVIALSMLLMLSCTKGVKVEPFEAERSFNKANGLLEKKRYTEARAEFDEVRRFDDSHQYAPLAQLRIADSYIMEDEQESAVSEYRRFLDDYPRHKYAPYALYKIGMVYFSAINAPDKAYDYVLKSLAEFQRLMDDYPRNPYRDEVLVKINKLKDTMAEHEFLIGEYYYKNGAFKGALGRLLPILDTYPGYAKTDEALYRIALSYSALDNEVLALKYLDRLLREYPGGPLAKEAQEEFDKVRKHAPVKG